MNIPAGQENAFPFFYQGPTTGPEVYYGLTVRDYFAAKALQGMVAQGDSSLFSTYYTDWEADARKGGEGKHLAKIAYAYADAMLEARKNI